MTVTHRKPDQQHQYAQRHQHHQQRKQGKCLTQRRYVLTIARVWREQLQMSPAAAAPSTTTTLTQSTRLSQPNQTWCRTARA